MNLFVLVRWPLLLLAALLIFASLCVPGADAATKEAVPPKHPVASVSDFFKIDSVKFLRKEPEDRIGIWKNPKGRKGVFCPCLEVNVTVRENTRSDKTFARAYFYGEDDKLMASLQTPSESGAPGQKHSYSAPVLFYKDQPNRFFFEVPEEVSGAKWKAVIVFGDKDEAQAAAYPATASAFRLDYPERKLVEDRSAKRAHRKPAMDPLIEHVVRTKNPLMPQITLFLRPPKGVSEAADVRGVMAICLLANGVDEMKRELRKEEMTGDYRGLFGFANEHKLAILAWGSRRLWDPRSNSDELPREKAKEIDESLDTVATAWERGVGELGEKYGIPQKNFLLWGSSGSAQWAKRLCLRKPGFFLAIHVHVPSSFDRPTPEAGKVLWCVTTGELESGYERSKHFVAECKKLGYPIVYKAIPGLGHARHPDASALGFEFFKFALLQKDRRDAHDEEKNGNKVLPRPWPEEFRAPAFYGDMVNQEMLPPDKVDRIPGGFRIALPTKEIADIWARDK